MRFFLTALAMVLLSGVPSHAQNTGLLRFGDFEAESNQSPPKGWVMWGGEQSKNPQNYTRDATTAHGGKASLRIFHPANTNGYIVTSLTENPLTPSRGRAYEISFWAKADTPGAAMFQVQGYGRVEPPADYTPVVSDPFPVGAEWRQFHFTVAESRDFFADTARHLMLAFSAVAVGENAVERTLWVDDVVVEEKPLPSPGLTLINPATIPYRKVPHRLAPGDTLRITVDVARRLHPTVRQANGVSWHRIAGYMGLPYDHQGRYQLTPGQEDAIRAMRLPHTRFYGVGDEPFSPDDTLDKTAHVLERTGTPQEGTVLELEDQGAQREMAPEAWARAVRHSLARGYGFRDWEVANEPWVLPGGKGAYPTAEDYAAHIEAVGAAIHRVQPNARIGLGVYPGELHWGNQILKQAAGHYDFVAGHWYSYIDPIKNPFEMVTAGENYRILDQMSHFNALLHAYNPGRDVYQYDTEWSLHSAAAGDVGSTRQNGNIVGAMHRAVRLIYYLREDIVRGASAWEMFSSRNTWNSLGVMAPEGDKKTMLYWTHRTFNEHLGDWVLDMNGTTPYYQPTATAGGAPAPLPGPLAPAVVMLSRDGRTVTAIVANASWSRPVPCRLRLNHFAATRARGVKLSSDDPNAPPLLERKEDFVSDFPVTRNGSLLTCTIPPHSIVFLTISR